MSAFNDLKAWNDFKEKTWQEVNGTGSTVGNDHSFEELLDGHDAMMDCADYTAAAKIKSVILARPEYPAYQAKINQASQALQAEYEAQSDLYDDSEVPF